MASFRIIKEQIMKERKPEYQGRTQEQQDSNEAVGAMSVILVLVSLLGLGIYELITWLLFKYK
jgi:hypothetical protein